MRPSSFLPLAVLGLVVLSLDTTTPLAAQDPIGATPIPLPPSSVGPRLFISDQGSDAVFVAVDLDMDGDANDAGELSVFYDDSSPGPDLATPRFIAVGPDGGVYVGDSNADFILRLEDMNGDGDANDAGEATVYYDTTSGGTPLVSINNIVFDADGYLYFSDNGTASGTDRHVTRIRDDDGDGFCAAVDGEIFTVYSFSTSTGTAIERPSGLAFDADGTLIVSDYETDHIFRLVDPDMDGDADSAGEQLEYFLSAPGAIELNFSESIAFGPPEGGVSPLYVNGGPVLDTVYRFFDGDLSGSIDNPTEVNVFWDLSQADGVIPGVAFRLAVHPDGSVYVGDGGQSTAGVNDQVVVLSDMNGDGDANDSDEATIFVDNTNAGGIVLGQASGLAFELPVAPPTDPLFVRGDCNDDASENLADAVFLLSVLFPAIGGPPTIPCDDACDGNDDESLDIADAITILASLFGNPTTPLPAPSSCGPDPDGAGGASSCDSFTSCP